jgi:hypothetical protein
MTKVRCWGKPTKGALDPAEALGFLSPTREDVLSLLTKFIRSKFSKILSQGQSIELYLKVKGLRKGAALKRTILT